MKMLKYSLLSFAILLNIIPVLSQPSSNYRFHTYSTEGGFYYDGISSILQDKDGFIWIVMENDIIRFDGYEYKRYLSNFQEFKTDDLQMFRSISIDKSGKIYVTSNNGLYTYKKANNMFERILDEKDIINIFIDEKDNIWLRRNTGLYKFDIRKKEQTPLLYNDKDIFIRNFTQFSKDHHIYMSTGYNRIFEYGEKSGVSLFYTFSDKYNIPDLKVTENKIWVMTQKGPDIVIFKIDIATKEIEDQFDILPERDEEKNIGRKFLIDRNNNLWVGTHKGIYVIDTHTKAHRYYTHDPSDKFSIVNNSIYTMMQDHQENIWIGTYAGGLSYVNLNESNWFRMFTAEKHSLNYNLVSCINEDDSYLWIGTEGGGVNCMDKAKETFTYFKYDNKRNSLSSNNIKSLIPDGENNLWISTYRGGLVRYDKGSGKFSNYTRKAKDKNSLASNDIRKSLLYKDKGLWIIYQRNNPTFSLFSFRDQSFTHHTIDIEDEQNSYIYDITDGMNNDLWLVTHKRLYQFDIESNDIKCVLPQNTPSLRAQSLCVTNNNVWIGTLGKGLIKYDINSKNISTFNEILNYNISTIYSICPDDENYLWLGTDNGLFKYDIKNNIFHRFDENDGVHRQYYPLACLKSKTGQLYFGSTGGLLAINPQNIMQNQYKPNVIISDFFINNISSIPVLTDSISGKLKEKVVLDYEQANFGFKFSSDNYLIPNKAKFKYRLKGYDQEWFTVDASGRTAMYSKVPPGNYTLEVYAANNDGIWGDTPAIIHIRCKPAPWFSWPALLLYALLIISIITVILYYYNEKRKLKIQLYIDNLDKQKKEKIHESELRFFTNISHEFRTPLSLILGAIDNIRLNNSAQYCIQILHNNATRLLNLVNELMDYRKISNGLMSLQVQDMDINSYVEELSSDFKNYAEKKEITYDIKCDPDLSSPIYADKQIIEKIVMNLLNNAFKYTKEGGHISIETFSDENKFISAHETKYTVKNEDVKINDPFLIVIRDTGIGISKESIGDVFNRYYKVKSKDPDAHLGTGIGLALVKSIILLHKGSITIHSTREQGTDIIVKLSKDPATYLDSEFLHYEDEDQSQIVPNATFTEQELNVPDVDMEDIFLNEKKRILLVEDNDELRMLITNFLSQRFEIINIPDAAEAAEILDQMQIDLIISDIMMPIKDGITFCKEVKNDINTSHIPFVLLTAKVGTENQMEGLGSGADFYFEKPIDFNLLLLFIQNIFKRQHYLREYYSKNYYVDSAELSANEQDNVFLKKVVEVIDKNLDQPDIDVNFIANEVGMGRSKLYSKMKALTGKSIIEFILSYKLRRAAQMIIEQDLTMQQITGMIGMKSQSYFSSVFKKEFGETPTAFAAAHRKNK